MHVTLLAGAELRVTSLASAQMVSDDREAGYRIYRLQEPLAPGATMELQFEVARAERGFTNTGLPRIRRRWRRALTTQLQRHVLQQRRHVPAPRLQPGRADHRPQRATQARARRRAARREARGRIGARQHGLPGCGLDQLRNRRQHQRRPDRARARLSAARMDARRPALFPLQDGSADAAVLLLSVGALAGAARRLARTADRDLLRRQASVQRRPHDRGDAEVARLLHGELLALPASSGAHPGVPALRAIRAELRQHDPVLGVDRLRRRPAQARQTSTTCSTSPRTRSRTSGGRTR